MSQLDLTNTTIDRFEILAELGRGGMGIVYQARQTDLDRLVALKILLPGLAHDTTYVHRFQQEARNAARLEHPHIGPMYEIGTFETHQPPLHYIAMKYIEGYTLKELLQREGTLSLEHAIDILTQVGEALDYSHQYGMIHRDIKPSNIMITDQGWVYLTDFGLTRNIEATRELTISGTVMGTPEYMSPEQARGEHNIGPATDIYALGVVLYEMLTDDLPFKADTPMAMVAARLVDTPRSPRTIQQGFPLPLEGILLKALAPDPSERFNNVAEMVASLRYVFKQLSNEAATIVMPASSGETTVSPQIASIPTASKGNDPPPPPGKTHSSFSILHMPSSLLISMAAIALIVLVVGVAASLFSPSPQPPTPPPTAPPPSPTTLVPTPTPPPMLDEQARLEEGWSYLDSEQYELAQQTFQQVLDTNPRSYQALSGLGWTSFSQETVAGYEQAIQEFTRSLVINPQQFDAHNGLGWSYYNLQDYENAEHHFRQAIQIGNIPDQDLANAYYGLGRTLEDDGHRVKALAAYRNALKFDSENETIKNTISRMR
jgi:serine/threonine-protein kinase